MLTAMSFHIVLVEPEIPPNAGNIVRLAANTGALLHFVRPLGFHLDERSLRRAGLDYHEIADLRVHDHWPACRSHLREARLFALTTRGTRRYDEIAYRPGDALVFGSESRGLPHAVLADIAEEQRLRLPMVAGSRSLNLANTAAVVTYEAWRQTGFLGA